MLTEITQPKSLLTLFQAARKPECPLCGSTQWSAAEVVSVDRKDLGVIWQHISARSPCGHKMVFTEAALRKAPKQDDRKLLRRCA